MPGRKLAKGGKEFEVLDHEAVLFVEVARAHRLEVLICAEPL